MATVAGVDFGTASIRVSIVHDERGRLGSGTADYPVIRRANDADFATQRHDDHCSALQLAFASALDSAGIEGTAIEALAIDATGSTVVPVDERLNPLGDYYLWCDHRAWREAQEITSKARETSMTALEWAGGTYSSEWGFAKVLHWLRSNPDQHSVFYTAFEHCDLIVATLCGIENPAKVPRSVCAMGHKWMWNETLGGLPSDEFLTAVDPLLAGLRDRMQGPYLTSDRIAGRLCAEWAQRLRLTAGIPVPVGALDAHWDAIGAGCRLGDVVNVIGTSTCIMALSDAPTLIPGVSGIVQGSIHPKKAGIESGLSAVGDLFAAIARRAGRSVVELTELTKGYHAGQTGLLRLAWDNGDRSVLIDPQLRGATLGWRLNSTAADEFFAAIEGTAFHTKIIMERLQDYAVPIQRVINAGGIPQRNETLNQVYANVLGKPIRVPSSDPTSIGAAVFAFLAAGTFKDVESAQAALCPKYREIEPKKHDVRIYEHLFDQFRELYFRLGQGNPLSDSHLRTN